MSIHKEYVKQIMQVVEECLEHDQMEYLYQYLDVEMAYLDMDEEDDEESMEARAFIEGLIKRYIKS